VTAANAKLLRKLCAKLSLKSLPKFSAPPPDIAPGKAKNGGGSCIMEPPVMGFDRKTN